ncbi:MAG: AraC family transcriptional regulator [Flavobacteriales bacterium]|nr:AraC family transcriptional regulator [Flavobacteriales bacterium]
MQFFTQGVNGIRKDARLIDGFSIFSIEDTLGKGNDEFGNDVFKRHRSGAYTVMYVDKGAGSHHIDFQKYTLHPGAVLFISPEQVQQYDPARLIGGYVLRFTPDFLWEYADPREAMAIRRLFDNQVRTSMLDARRYRDIVMYFEMVLREYNHANDQLRASIIKSSLNLLLLHADRLITDECITQNEEEVGFSYYTRFRARIPQRLGETRNASDYAEELGISYKYLNDLTKRFAGCTSKEIIDRTLIAEAKRLVVEGQISVGQISRELGFDEPTNFRKYFRKHTGMAPLKFRQEN